MQQIVLPTGKPPLLLVEVQLSIAPMQRPLILLLLPVQPSRHKAGQTIPVGRLFHVLMVRKLDGPMLLQVRAVTLPKVPGRHTQARRENVLITAR